MSRNRERTNQIAREYLQRGDALGWFERLYQTAGRDPSSIPWADLKPNPNFSTWAETHGLCGSGKRALVVGCGLGDDAEALAGLGFDVAAFDVSPAAIAWARERFPRSRVDYSVADLFEGPQDWKGRFDFVLEAYTLQVLPPELQGPAMDRIAQFVAPGGSLLVICRGRDDAQPAGDSIPWQLSRTDLLRLVGKGLKQVSFEDYIEQEDPPIRRFRAVYRA